MGAHDGLLVVSLEQAVAAPLCTARLAAAGTAYASPNEVADLSVYPQLRRVETATATGPVLLPAPPTRWTDTAPSVGPVPAVGEHSTAIRAEFA